MNTILTDLQHLFGEAGAVIAALLILWVVWQLRGPLIATGCGCLIFLVIGALLFLIIL